MADCPLAAFWAASPSPSRKVEALRILFPEPANGSLAVVGFQGHWASTHDDSIVIPDAAESSANFARMRVKFFPTDRRFHFDGHRAFTKYDEIRNVAVALKRLVLKLPPNAGEKRGPLGLKK